MSKKQKTTTTASPWVAAQPLLTDIIGKAQGMGTDGFKIDPFAGPRVADLSPETMSGISALSAGSPITGAAEGAVLSNLNMDETYRNFDTIRDTTADSVKANLASTCAGGGLNSGLAQDTYTRALTESLGGLEFGAYNDAKNRQLQAAGLAPSIGAMGRADAGAQLAAGGILDDHAQRNIDADMQFDTEKKTTDIDALERYARLGMGLGGMGASGTSTEPVPLKDSLKNAGTIASGIGTALAFFSDRGLKQNIRADGDRHVYNYLWSPIRFRGDLSEKVPERIIGKWHGFDVVEFV
ncbi:MAG: hypothetical protein WBC85_08890 [Planktotalea sp.]|uniref:hypothetical protein n=1 Tax=Planktotalea sp. TaxID=2029877 RepID=UPI003C72002E